MHAATAEKREAESARIREKYPDRVPVRRRHLRRCAAPQQISLRMHSRMHAGLPESALWAYALGRFARHGRFAPLRKLYRIPWAEHTHHAPTRLRPLQRARR